MDYVKRVQSVLERIDRAAKKSGRKGSDVQLIAVTKYAQIGEGVVEGFIEAGLTDFGESRPQKLVEKAEHFSNHSQKKRFNWHLIGHLQRNKVRAVLPHCALIHSLDTVRLAEELNTSACGAAPIRCLLEVRISCDESKHGFLPHEIPAALEYIRKLEHIEIAGLMGMSGLESDAPQQHKEFALLRELNVMRGYPILSMGMSSDFEIAVEEGSTMVRIGSLLYPQNYTA